jgi:hypothetical protein
VPGVDFTEVQLLRRNDTQQLFNITNKALASEVATLTTSTTHNLTAGQVVAISGVDGTFNGTYAVATAPTTTTFTYAKPGATNVTSAALAASFSINNKARTGTTATLTTTAAHNLVVNQTVTIAGVETALNGKVVVTSVPSSTTFTYTTASSGTIASAAVSPVGTVQVALAQALVVNYSRGWNYKLRRDMAATYPASIRAFTTKVNIRDIIDESDANNLQEEVVAIETILGVTPSLSTTPSSSGTFNATSTTFASVSARLANIEIGIVGDTHTQYLKKVDAAVTTASTSSGVVRNIFASTSNPTGGIDGDVWLKYS